MATRKQWANLCLIWGAEKKEKRERRKEGGRHSRWLIVFLFCLQRMIMDIQSWWHIFMMDGTVEAGDYPAGIVRSLIKWQIVTRKMCICPWGSQSLVCTSLSLVLSLSNPSLGYGRRRGPMGFVLADLFSFLCLKRCISAMHYAAIKGTHHKSITGCCLGTRGAAAPGQSVEIHP